MEIAAILIAILAIIIALFPNPIRDFLIEKFGHPLEIQPTSKKLLDLADCNEEFFISLINKTNHNYYRINITSEFPNNINVAIFPEKPNLLISPISPNFNFGLENKETRITQTIINNVGPNEIKKMIVVVNKGNYNKNFQQEYQINFNVSGFSKNPQSIISK